MLNTNEKKALVAIQAAAEAHTGGEFCDVADVSVEGLNRKQLGGYLSVLRDKGVICMYNMGDYIQITNISTTEN